MMDSRLVRHPLGFWQVKDLPTPEELRRYYAERYFQTSQGNYRSAYSPEELSWFDTKNERVASLVGEVRGPRPGAFLDVGCGEGFAMDWFLRAGWDVRGLDFSRAGLEAMNPHLLDRVTTGDVQQLLDEELSAKNAYDLLWLTNVLEHVPDPPALLTKLRALLAPGGACAITVPNDGSAWQEYLLDEQRIPERFWIAIPDHLAYFDATSLRAIASATGWRCERLIADFPIDWFLGNPESEYVSDKAKGRGAHRARIAVDTVLARQPVEKVNAFYEAMAEVGMGRQLVAVLT